MLAALQNGTAGGSLIALTPAVFQFLAMITCRSPS
jgi:hypothetical protein